MSEKLVCPDCGAMFDDTHTGRKMLDRHDCVQPERDPRDGESYDQQGNTRPVPPHVSNTPEQ